MSILKVTKKPLYEGFLTLVEKTIKHPSLKDGKDRVLVREVLEVGETVCGVIYDRFGHILLTEQYRHHGPSIEGVAGFVDEGEIPLTALIREVQEEVNINLDQERVQIQKIGKIRPTSGIVDQVEHLYAIQVPRLESFVSAQPKNHFGGEESEGEEIRYWIDTLYSACDHTIEHPPTLLILNWIKENARLIP